MTTLNPEDNAPQWRTRLKAARAQMSPADQSRGALLIRARLFTWLGNFRQALQQNGQATGAAPVPTCIAAFWPMAHEPDLRALMTQWVQEHDLTVALPVVEAAGQPLTFHRWHPDAAMTTGAYGIDIPAAHDPVVPDVVLVPTLGFTTSGDRLGYGAGFYDRTLAALRQGGAKVVTIGIGWSVGEMDESYSPAPHDQRLDAILTEDGWTPFAPGTAPGPKTSSLYSVRL